MVEYSPKVLASEKKANTTTTNVEAIRTHRDDIKVMFYSLQLQRS